MGIAALYIALYTLCVAAVFVNCLQYIHILQLESYQNVMYAKWVVKNYTKLFGLLEMVLSFAGLALVLFLSGREQDLLALILLIVIVALISGSAAYRYFKLPKKKPLVFTDRVRRLCYALLFVIIVLYVILTKLTDYPIFMFLPLLGLSPWLVELANLIMFPAESSIKRGYLNEAKKILTERPDLIKIGITGSFGKTSSKFILKEILSVKYNCLASPASYNTPMGLTRVIREMLKPEHEVLIAEMGARYVGDIKELTDLVHPKYGLITSIGKQHLETFGSFENIVRTKYSLIEELPKDGIGYLPNDGGAALEQYYKQDKTKRLFSVDKSEGAYVYAENIEISSKGCAFDLVSNQGRIRLDTVLLGRHNIQNILGACAVALDLGLSLEQIQTGVAAIAPIEHRLQLINSPSGVTVIDDAFNANPSGTKMALDVLQYFPGRKMIVTPGLVELGNEEAELNRQFGRDIARTCDIAILVGKAYSGYLKEGLLEEGFDPGAIVEYDNLEQVTNFIGAYAVAGDVVLFENDLPDNYL